MKKRELLVVIITIIFLSENLYAQSQHSNNARGFNANGVYSGFDIDSINHFNGNLVIKIPIGQTYPVNGSLSYSLKLIYNSFIWSQETVCGASFSGGSFSTNYAAIFSLRRRTLCGDGGAIVRVCRKPEDGFTEAYQDVYAPALINPYILVSEGKDYDKSEMCQALTGINPASNAGIGWQLHLGKLFRPLSSVKYAQPLTTEKLYEVYESPDGSEHQFYAKLHEDDPDDSVNYFYTRDGSYLRLWKNPTPPSDDSYTSNSFDPAKDTYRIEFPNGETHHFQSVKVQDTVTQDGNNNPLYLAYSEDKIVRIDDRFGNYIAVDYFDDGTDGDSLKDNRWEITDSANAGRKQIVNFIKSNSLTLIKTINMQTVNGAYDTYTLDYATSVPTDIAKPHALQGFFPGYNTGTGTTAEKMLLPYLTAINLPDGSQYSMPMNGNNIYDANNSYLPDIQRVGALAPGALIKMTLPTGGRIKWDYFYPDRNTDDGYGYYFSPGSSGRQHARVAPGVRRRSVYAGPSDNTLIGTWAYDPLIGIINHDGCSWAAATEPCGAYQIVNRVTQPTGDYTDYYFSVYPHPGPGSGREGRGEDVPHAADYGLPFTKSPIDNNGALNSYIAGGVKMFLSSRVYGADHQAKRTNYVRYEGDKYAFTDGFGNTMEYNPRLVASATVYDDDSNRFSGVKYSDFDGLGHYRKSETFGNIGTNDTRIEITNYNPDRGTYLIDSVNNARASIGNFYTPFPESRPWVLGTYSYQLAWQSGQKAVAYFNFDSNNLNGRLLGKRVRKDIEEDNADYSMISPNQVPLTLGEKDVLVQYNYVNGNISSESYFGGDKQGGLSTGVTFPGLANSSSEYKIDYGYVCQKPGGGQGTSSAVSNKSYRVMSPEVGFKVIDNTIDCVTGLPISSRDTAGVATEYEYGAMSRMTFIKHSQGSYDQIRYQPHTGPDTGRSKVTVSRRPNMARDGATLSEDIYVYDELGRLVTEKKRMPGGTYQVRDTNYNAMNWVTSVSEWKDEGEIPQGKLTKYNSFDAFGRPIQIEQPDMKVITMGYAGDRQVTRSVNIGYQLATLGSAVSEQNSTTKEIYDRHGRLVQLIEPSGAAGQNTTWAYWYNVNNKLGGASATDSTVSGAVQNRSFAYDNLGNLLRQSLPEVPWSQFEYDTMGNVTKSYDGKHWLNYVYDTNARIKEIQELDEPVWQWRTLKSYSYYNANDVDANGNPSPGNKGLGKLMTATRVNRVGNPYEVLNVAAGKPATQSSTWAGIPASLAVDGSTDGNRFSHTDFNNQAWWQVDLGGSYSLEQVNIWNRTDCCGDRLSNFYVLVSDDPFVSTDLNTVRNQPGVSSYYFSGQASTPTKFNIWRTGRYVRVQLASPNYLSLAEVQVMASSVNLYNINVSEQYSYAGVDGQLDKQVMSLNSGSPKPYSFQQTFTYDAIGNLRTQTYPQCTNPTCASTSQAGGSRSHPWTVNYRYLQGWLTNVGAGTSDTSYASIAYNNNGMLSSITHTNGIVDTWGQDPNSMQRPASIDVRRPGAAQPYWNSGTYKFDGAGNITRMGDDWYLYDKANRLVEGSVMKVGMKRKYGYDAFGNTRTVTTYVGVTTPTNGTQDGPVFNSATNSAKNQYTFNYDGAGNTLGVLGAPGQPTPQPIYVYDGMNMIKFVPGSFITHLYGPDDERVWTLRKQPGFPSTVTETITLRGLNNEVLREYQVNNGDELTQWQWMKDYIYAGSRLLASESPLPSGLRHYHLDHLGTPRVITDGSGNMIGTTPYYYFPFGDEATAEPPPDEKLRFTGHERDTNDPFRLDYMHARYYYRGGAAGKFMSVDPIKDWDPKQPQSWNLYSYVRNNPINMIDPDGREPLVVDKGSPNLMSLLIRVAMRPDGRQILAELAQSKALIGIREGSLPSTNNGVTFGYTQVALDKNRLTGAVSITTGTTINTQAIFDPVTKKGHPLDVTGLVTIGHELKHSKTVINNEQLFASANKTDALLDKLDHTPSNQDGAAGQFGIKLSNQHPDFTWDQAAQWLVSNQIIRP